MVTSPTIVAFSAIKQEEGMAGDLSLTGRITGIFLEFMRLWGYKVMVSGFWFLVSGFWFLVSGFWFLVSGFWFLVSGFWFLVSGFWS
jgi:hypothetical protein